MRVVLMFARMAAELMWVTAVNYLTGKRVNKLEGSFMAIGAFMWAVLLAVLLTAACAGLIFWWWS